MTPLKTVFLILLFVGCIGIIIILSTVFIRIRYDCVLDANHLPVTGIIFTQLSTRDVLVTWDRHHACHQGYEVIYTSRRGTIITTAQTENIIIPDQDICFEFDIRIRPINGDSSLPSGTATFHDPQQLDVLFSIPMENSSRLIITWTHPNQGWCLLPFMVSYETPFDNIVVNVTVPEVEFDFVYCTSASLTIRGINPDDDNLLSAESATVVDATQYPGITSIGHITFVNTTLKEHELKLEWDPIGPIGTCIITYQILFSTELGELTLTTQDPMAVLSRDFFCFTVNARIHLIMPASTTFLGESRTTYTVEPVQDLKLTVLTNSNRIALTWRHLLEERCDLRYNVTFQHRSLYQLVTTATNIQTQRFYCVNATATVKTLRRDGATSEERIVTIPEEYPTSLEPVQNVVLDKAASSVNVSWSISSFITDCENLYEVTAMHNATSEEGTCQGTRACGIVLSEFCPTTVFRIKPASPLEGEEVVETLIC